jgi:putative transport protein
VLFVYTVGLSSGPGFFASLRGSGLRDNLFVVAMIALAATLTLAAYAILHLKATLAAGLFTGSLTNTPALAAVLEFLKNANGPNAGQSVLSEPVVGYSIAYPVSVLGMILCIYFARRIWKGDFAAEASKLRELRAAGEKLQSRTVRVTDTQAGTLPVRDLIRLKGWDVIFGRVKRDGELSLASEQTRFQPGDLVTVVGSREELDRVMQFLGEPSSEFLELDRRELDYRRLFVSNPAVVGHRLRDIDLPQQFGAIVTRVRRGDIELLPHGDTTLELGDRVRVLTKRNNMEAVANFFGDSYRAVSEIDMLSFSLGLALGLVLGLVPIPLPGGITLKLGLAGGPLIVALLLGAMERTGPIVWSLPYSANLMLRQVGLILFLAGVGTRAGYDFFQTLISASGLTMLGVAVVIVCLTGIGTLWVGYRLLKIPFGLLIGMLAGLQTQPATLGFALEQACNELPNIGYARVIQVAENRKIVIAQLLIAFLS